MSLCDRETDRERIFVCMKAAVRERERDKYVCVRSTTALGGQSVRCAGE